MSPVSAAPLELFYRLNAAGEAVAVVALQDGLAAVAPIDWSQRPDLGCVRGEIRVTLDREPA